MATKTNIEWCNRTASDGTLIPGATVNVWWGCEKVSPACAHCYAERMARRFGKPCFGRDARRWIRWEAALRELRSLERRAVKSGHRPIVFVNSMSDVFEDREELRQARCEAVAAFSRLEHLHIMLLTKRPENIERLWDQAATDWGTPGALALGKDAFPNVWMGVTVEGPDQQDRIGRLAQIDVAGRFVSSEPMLANLSLRRWMKPSSPDFCTHEACHDWGNWPCDHPDCECRAIHWWICGGESGHYARPTHPDWVRSLRYQCVAAGVPFFFKQWGEWEPVAPVYDLSNHYNERVASVTGQSITLDLDGIQWPRDQPPIGAWIMERVGKRKSGALLDGRTWNEFPAAFAE